MVEDLFFVQVRGGDADRWMTVGTAGSRAIAARAAERDWAPVTRMLETAEFRVVSDRQLEAEGGAVALAQAVASLHAEALRAQSWISLSG